MILRVVFIIGVQSKSAIKAWNVFLLTNKMKSQICGKHNDKKATR